MRVFIAINLPLEVRKKIASLSKSFKLMESAKWINEDNLHLTLKFYGELSKQELEKINTLVPKALMDINPFEISFKNFGAFPSFKKPRILWLGVSEGSENLITIAENIEKYSAECGFKTEERKYHPHLTVGRFKMPKPIDDKTNTDTESFSFLCKKIDIMESILETDGPKYSITNSVKLGETR
ncbi:RNA 2',3'-cyclic phosphodiesterase [Elusimicrobiota bacterium]